MPKNAILSLFESSDERKKNFALFIANEEFFLKNLDVIRLFTLFS